MYKPSLLDSRLDEYVKLALLNENGAPNIHITSDDQDIVRILTEFLETSGLSKNLTEWARIGCKYGSSFVQLNMDDNNQVFIGEILSTSGITIYEENYKYYYSYQFGETNRFYNPNEILHFKFGSDINRSPYGTPILDFSVFYDFSDKFKEPVNTTNTTLSQIRTMVTSEVEKLFKMKLYTSGIQNHSNFKIEIK